MGPDAVPRPAMHARATPAAADPAARKDGEALAGDAAEGGAHTAAQTRVGEGATTDGDNPESQGPAEVPRDPVSDDVGELMAIADATAEPGPASPAPGAPSDPHDPSRDPSDDKESLPVRVDEPVLVIATGGGAEPEGDASGPGWTQLTSGRWSIGDPGSQPSFAAKPSERVQARADLTLDWAGHGVLNYVAASMRGLGHFEDGKPRQDSCSLFFTKDRAWLIGCVADGVSAGTLSHAAADIACDVIPRHLEAALAAPSQPDTSQAWPERARALPWQQAVDAASAAIVEKATPSFENKYRREGDSDAVARLADDGPRRRDVALLMATTAVAFVVGTAADDAGLVPFAVLVAAGDSSALILSERHWHPITDVKNAGADVASSAVYPLPREVEVRPCVGFLQGGQALAVITDGVGDPLGTGRGVVGRFLAERWSVPPDPIAFANDMAFYRRTFTDDRTAALVWVRPGTG